MTPPPAQANNAFDDFTTQVPTGSFAMSAHRQGWYCCGSYQLFICFSAKKQRLIPRLKLSTRMSGMCASVSRAGANTFNTKGQILTITKVHLNCSTSSKETKTAAKRSNRRFSQVGHTLAAVLRFQPLLHNPSMDPPSIKGTPLLREKGKGERLPNPLHSHHPQSAKALSGHDLEQLWK